MSHLLCTVALSFWSPCESQDSATRRAQVLPSRRPGQSGTPRRTPVRHIHPAVQTAPPPQTVGLTPSLCCPRLRPAQLHALTRSTTSLCRSNAFCFPFGISEALDGARSCSSRSNRRPRSHGAETVAGPWRRMARGGPGTRGARTGLGDRKPGRDQSLAPPRSEAGAACINAPFTRAPPSHSRSLPPPWTPGVSIP